MSRIRGGSNSSLIRIGSDEVRAWSERIDICIPLGTASLANLEGRVGPGTHRVNTFRWFRKYTCYLEETHDKTSREEAFKRVIKTRKLPLGIF